MRLVVSAASLLLIWGLSFVQLTILRKRKLTREFWVSIGYLVAASAAIILLGLEVRPRSVIRTLSDWFWIP